MPGNYSRDPDARNWPWQAGVGGREAHERGGGGDTQAGTERRDQRAQGETERRTRKDGETLGTESAKGERGDSDVRRRPVWTERGAGAPGQSPRPPRQAQGQLGPHHTHTPHWASGTTVHPLLLGLRGEVLVPIHPHPLLDSCPPNALGTAWSCRGAGAGPTHRSADSSPDAQSPECRPPGSTGHTRQGARRDRGPGSGVRGQDVGPGAGPSPPGHTHCQRSFSLLASGASRSRPPLRAAGDQAVTSDLRDTRGHPSP